MKNEPNENALKYAIKEANNVLQQPTDSFVTEKNIQPSVRNSNEKKQKNILQIRTFEALARAHSAISTL